MCVFLSFADNWYGIENIGQTMTMAGVRNRRKQAAHQACRGCPCNESRKGIDFRGDRFDNPSS